MGGGNAVFLSNTLTTCLMCFICFLVKSMQHLTEKTQCLGFLFFPGSAEALVKRSWKIKFIKINYLLIAYLLSIICAKNYQN